jgi:hypothetical protein
MGGGTVGYQCRLRSSYFELAIKYNGNVKGLFVREGERTHF